MPKQAKQGTELACKGRSSVNGSRQLRGLLDLFRVRRRRNGLHARLEPRPSLARRPQQHHVESGLRYSKKRRAIRDAHTCDELQLKRLSTAHAQPAEGGAEAARLDRPRILGLFAQSHRGRFLERRLALPTLPSVRRIGPLLCVCLIPLRAAGVETLRIAMEETGSTVEVSGRSLLFGRDDEEAQFAPLNSSRAKVRPVDGQLEVNGAPWEHEAVRFRLTDSDSEGSIRTHGFTVRGDVVVRLHSSRLQLINVLPLEEYLLGVVGAEMPPGFPDEALKAQAIAARTYALRKKLDAADPSVHLGASVLHQVYRGLSRPDQRVREAIEATRGEILTFNLEPIEAYFHASCGGKTEAGQPALSRDLPYLRSVECPCGKLASNRWEVSISAAELHQLFGIRDGGAMSISGRSNTGRVKALLLGAGRSLDAVEFRQKLGYDRVKSLWFELERAGDGAIKIVGRGYGHGAGLCQRGAKVLADQGRSYRDILLHYYPGVEIQQLY